MKAPWSSRRLLLIDLDDTLYRVPEIAILMRENIQGFMQDRLQIPAEEVAALCAECYSTYGTTMAGLEARGYHLPYDEWHAAVHGALPYDRLLSKDTALGQLLHNIPLPKWIFTNADIKHATTCLQLLGLSHHFEGIICFESIQLAASQQGLKTAACPITCKPDEQAFKLALQQCGGEAATTIFLDDSTRNVATATRMGMFTVQVGCHSTEVADLAVPTLHQLPEWLWSEPASQAALEAVPALQACCQEEVLVTS